MAAISHAERLPDELCVDTFSRLSLWDRVRAATVCRRWRNASLGSPHSLWSIIPPFKRPEACRFFLERARRVPVTFRLRLGRDNIEPFSDIIKDHLHHIRVLDLVIHFADEEHVWAVDQMRRCLAGPAPMLETFGVVNGNVRPHIDLGALPSLNNRVLRTIKLKGVGLSCLTPCAGAANVRSLVIAEPDPRHRFTEDYWSSLSTSFPALESLALQVVQRTSLPTGSVFPATLNWLSLELGFALFERLIATERFARLDFLRVAFRSRYSASPNLATVLPLFRDVVPASGAVRFNGSHVGMMVVDPAGRKRIVEAVKCDPSWCVPLAPAARITIGGLVEHKRWSSDGLSRLPALEELTLDVGVGYGAPTDLWHRWPRLECPNLRALHVRSTLHTSVIQLDVLSDALRHSPGNVATLVLDRVHVLAPPGVDVATALNGLAGTVSVVSTGTIWPECHSAWATNWDRMVR